MARNLIALSFCFVVFSGIAKADEQLVEEVQVVLDRMAEIYREDPNGSRQVYEELWLKDDNLVYMSEQFIPVFYGAANVAPYWTPAWDTLYGYREVYSNLQATYLASDIVIATFEVRYDMHAVTRTPLAGWSRMIAVLRKTDDGWKIQQHYEAPMSIISQGRRIHEEALDPNFADFARSQNPDYDVIINNDANIQARKEGTPWVPRPRFDPGLLSDYADEDQEQDETQ